VKNCRRSPKVHHRGERRLRALGRSKVHHSSDRRLAQFLRRVPVIAPMLVLGLSARRIYRNLVAGDGFGGSYPSVSRYVAKLKASVPERVGRIECEPGRSCRWTSDSARRSSSLAAKPGGPGCSGRFCGTRAGATARWCRARTPRRSRGRSKTPCAISAECPVCSISTTSRRR
jgi:hypothetical protein